MRVGGPAHLILGRVAIHCRLPFVQGRKDVGSQMQAVAFTRPTSVICSPLALDSDEVDAAARAAGPISGQAAISDLLRFYFAERNGLAVFARLAISTRHRLAAIRSARQALIDAIAVGMIFHDKDFGLRTGRSRQSQKDNQSWGDEHTHGKSGSKR